MFLNDGLCRCLQNMNDKITYRLAFKRSSLLNQRMLINGNARFQPFRFFLFLRLHNEYLYQWLYLIVRQFAVQYK